MGGSEEREAKGEGMGLLWRQAAEWMEGVRTYEQDIN